MTHTSWHNCKICKFPRNHEWLESFHLRHIDLALVHELHDGHDVGERGVLEYHHLVRLVEVDEQLFEVGAAGGEDHLQEGNGDVLSSGGRQLLTLWHLTCRPSAATTTSVNCSWPSSLLNTLNRLFWWLFHLRQYCCPAVPTPPDPPIVSTI